MIRDRKSAQEAAVVGLLLIAIFGVGCSQNAQPGPAPDPPRVYWQEVFESIEGDHPCDPVVSVIPDTP